MTRVICVWLTDWPLERSRHRARGEADGQADKTPLVLTALDGRIHCIVAANAMARAAGIVPGMRHVDACALIPDLSVRPADPEADRKALLRLAEWATRWSPIVALGTCAYQPCRGEELWLEIRGCAHLWGGEAELAADMSRRLTALGLSHRLGLADTPGAAWAAARYGAYSPCLVPERTGREFLAPLPVEALRLHPGTTHRLRRFGLTSIGQILDMDRAALARRFPHAESEPSLLSWLDQALGHDPEPLDLFRPPAAARVSLSCPEPLLHTEGICAGLDHLLERLCRQLQRRRCVADLFMFRGFHGDGHISTLEARLARPCRDPAHIRVLFKERLGTFNPGFGVDALTLEAADTTPEDSSHPGLFPTAGKFDATALVRLADRIAARLGDDCVQTFAYGTSVLPERSEQRVRFEAPMPWGKYSDPVSPRPLRLLVAPEPVEVMAEVPEGPPIQFVWRGNRHKIRKATGPERMSPPWWLFLQGTEPEWRRVRDYYRIEDAQARRFWMFRHGPFTDGNSPPRWYLHGFFA